MSQAQHVHQLLQQLGPANADVANVTQITEDSWAVGFDPQSVVLLQLDDGGSRLVFTLAVGEAGEAVRPVVNQSLLAYNALWRETGGVCMAVADGAVLQICSVDAASLDLERLSDVLANFVQKARVWRRYMESAGSLGSEAAAGLRV